MLENNCLIIFGTEIIGGTISSPAFRFLFCLFHKEYLALSPEKSPLERPLFSLVMVNEFILPIFKVLLS